MSTDIGYQIQRQLFSTLNGDATLSGIVTGVFDFVPQGQEFPFIRIGEAEFTRLESQTTTGFEGEITVDVWSRESTLGTKPVNEILSRISDLMHNTDSIWNIADHCMINFRENFRTVLVEEDSVTYHGVIRFSMTLGRNYQL